MVRVRAAIWFVVGLIVATAVASGPLVAGVDLTREDAPGFCGGGGTAVVDVVSAPADGFALEQERFGAETYHLSGPDAEVHVRQAADCPRVVYRLRLPELGVDARSVVFVENTGEVELSAPNVRVAPKEVDANSYEAILTIELEGDEPRVLHRANVTVEVVD